MDFIMVNPYVKQKELVNSKLNGLVNYPVLTRGPRLYTNSKSMLLVIIFMVARVRRC